MKPVRYMLYMYDQTNKKSRDNYHGFFFIINKQLYYFLSFLAGNILSIPIIET